MSVLTEVEKLALSVSTNQAIMIDLAEERRHGHSAITTILAQVGVGTLILFGAYYSVLQDDQSSAALTTIMGSGVALLLFSMFGVKKHRRNLLKIEVNGYKVQLYLKDRGIKLPVDLFDDPTGKEIGFWTIPSVCHIMLAVAWVVVWWMTAV